MRQSREYLSSSREVNPFLQGIAGKGQTGAKTLSHCQVESWGCGAIGPQVTCRSLFRTRRRQSKVSALGARTGFLWISKPPSFDSRQLPDACGHTWTRADRTAIKPRRTFGFHAPFSCFTGTREDEFARGFGRGGSLVPGRSADMDRDAEPAIHGHAYGVASLLCRRPSLAASEGEPLTPSNDSFPCAACIPRRGSTRAH
jgi:hypothetical protein